MRDLKDIRTDINKIDTQMRELFTARMKAAHEVAEYKSAHGIPILDSAREAEVIEKNASELPSLELRPYYIKFLEHTMSVSRSYQDNLISGMKVAYSGERGAFAYIAATKLFPNARKIAYKNFTDAYDACRSGECDAAVLPIENSYNGEVGAVTDLMFSGPLTVNSVIDVDVSHCLLGVKGAAVSDIKTVTSHPQALAQCNIYIREHGFAEEDFENTALAAEHVAAKGDKTLAAIGSESAAEIFGLEILEKNINQSKSNTTRFASFSRMEHLHAASEAGINSILLFTVKNEAGALAKALDIIGKHGFNMRNLRSRPMKELMWQYYFYIEAEGNIGSKEGKRLLEDLNEYCDKIKCAGTYVDKKFI